MTVVLRRLGQRVRRVPRHIVLLVVLILIPVAILCVAVQRHGIDWGDDWSLYTRQAKGLVDGNVGQVIADNHVNVDSAAKPGFSPYVYPWSFPVLLAPFVRLWGLNFDKLKRVEVACWIGFLACWFGVLRRRMSPWLALCTTAAAGYALTYIIHTDSILSEIPYMAAVAFTFWFADRIRVAAGGWDTIPRKQLVLLGLAMMVVFNVRREGLAMVPAIMAMQAADVWPRRRTRPDWRALATPHVVFVGSVVLLQLMLPSALAPAYDGSGLKQTWSKLRGPFQTSFVQQLGFDRVPGWVLLSIVLVIAAGVAVRMRKNAADDVGIIVFALVSVTIAGMIPAVSPRYTMAVTPLLAYFGVQAFAAIPRSRQILGAVAAGCLVTASAVDIPLTVEHSHQFNVAGQVQSGPLQPSSQEMFQAVRTHTHRDDLIAFFKARALTLYTDRRAVQSKDLDIILQRADYFVMGGPGGVGIPILTDAEVKQAGLIKVWSDGSWTLFKVPAPTVTG